MGLSSRRGVSPVIERVSPDFPDSPFYTGLRPTDAKYTQIDPWLKKHLCSALGRDGQVLRVSAGDGLSGCYRLIGKDGRVDRFVTLKM